MTCFINMTLDKNNLNSSQVIENDFYSATLSDKGEWIYKSKIPELKLDGKYKDAPRFPIIYEYEGEFKDDYQAKLVLMVKDIGKKLVQIYKQQEK